MTDLYFTGLDGETGTLLHEPRTIRQMLDATIEADHAEDPGEQAARRTAHDNRLQSGRTYGLMPGYRPHRIDQARWGVIYHEETPAEVRAHVDRLVAHRGGTTYVLPPGKDHNDFRAEHGQGPGVVDPTNLPYYLLITASPRQIPFRFQYGLDIDHAVGRLHFDGDAAAYGEYVDRLISYEKAAQPPRRERRIGVFAPEHPGDESTFRSRRYLAESLCDEFGKRSPIARDDTVLPYLVEDRLANKATKASLVDLVCRDERQPALVFTAGHGVGYGKNSGKQGNLQGALACRWSGADGKIPVGDLFSAEDIVREDPDLDGLVVFSFGCYTAGTPREDDFAHLKGDPVKVLADEPFVAALPQRLLERGALGVIGHVDRAWSTAFLTPGIGVDITTIWSLLAEVLAGAPLGHAFEAMNQKYLSLSARITDRTGSPLRKYRDGDRIDEAELVRDCIALQDARSYVLLGDPFARVRAKDLAGVPGGLP